ncbi:hypothetical protein KY289_016903 [Solanum tuberosum]|nr:hypothetical protein KY284_016699 [Solanum tuberosum]KAH0689545.1 hypothetical protein KY289_016903 [Solanum tuberosum]
MSFVPVETSTSKKLQKKKLHQMIDTRSLSVCKRMRVHVTNNFPENCHPSVRQNNGNTVQQHDVLIKHKLNVPKISSVYSRCEWFSNGGRIINESKLPAISEYEHIQKRKQVRETLKRFADEYTKLLREKNAEKQARHINIEAAKILRKEGKWVNSEWAFGHVPGVEIGDQFRFKVELAMVGLHHEIFRGIDYVYINRKNVATCIVDSGLYENETISSQKFIYIGQGGNPRVSVNARVEDQKLKRDNLALKNSMDLGYSVRVIYGRPRVNGEKIDGKYIYYGLYTVTKCWRERGPTGKYIFKFELQRNLGQQELTQLVNVNHICENVNKAPKSTMQTKFVMEYDVSQGKENIPILTINEIDDERPPPFTYITNMQYPDWYYIIRPQGCSCTSRCSTFDQCSYASKNGGEFPFNPRSSILKAKPLVHECGPYCKCPPSCKNRVSQHGLRYHFEVFKTKSKGWGLRSSDYIAPGSFICEYIGELLDHKEAKIRMDYDEYFFDVGNYNEYIPKRKVVSSKVESNSFKRKDEDGFTIDAAIYGNVGRFINHSCSPNLCAQNVMYDHGDKRVPHIMFFASKSIYPLEELTYHYNHRIVHVHDTNGNLKREKGKCGSHKCNGRM